MYARKGSRADGREADDDDNNNTEMIRQRLEITFAVFDGDRVDPMSAFLRGEKDDDGAVTEEKRPSPTTRALDRMYNTADADDQSYEIPCEGEGCEIDDGECKIPESFKIVPGEDSVDVMAFLGIQRAQPLTARKDVGDWQ